MIQKLRIHIPAAPLTLNTVTHRRSPPGSPADTGQRTGARSPSAGDAGGSGEADEAQQQHSDGGAAEQQVQRSDGDE